MSFVERNKLWLLPLLGLGVVAVGWYNMQAFSGPKTPPPEPQAPPAAGEAAPSAQASAPATPAPAVPAGGGEGGGLWDDLKPLALVPGDLNRLEALDNQARGVLPASALQEGGSEALRMSGPKVWIPKERPRPVVEGHEAPAGPPAPDPDILVQLPEGRRVWIDGVGYREAEALAQKPWRVRRIEPRAVELQGPKGTETKPIHPASPRPAKEGP